MATTGFGCDKCEAIFPTLNLALQHLRSEAHRAETWDLVMNFDKDYRTIAARKFLFSYTRHSAHDHDLAIAAAEGRTPPRKPAGHRVQFANDDETPAKPAPAANNVISNREQTVVNAPNVITNVFMEPINIRVHLTVNPALPTTVFSFPYLRSEHTTVLKLLREVAERYEGDHDLETVAARRLMMHLLKKGIPTIGGVVQGDEDLRGIGAVQGGGWYGQLQIG